MDFFARNIVKDLPFMSRYVTSKYNKYLLSKHRDKLLRIKNFLNFKITEKDDLSEAFDKLNYIRLKIMLIERDISAYRNALKLSFDTKDKNIVLQKKIRHKYAKLRKYDTYQNLSLGIIYDKCTTDDKIASLTAASNKDKKKIIDKFDSTTMLQSMQRNFIFNIIANRQEEDQIFINDVNVPTLKKLLQRSHDFTKSMHNIDTFTNQYLNNNPGSLSRAFVKFKASHSKATINNIVKDYLNLYKTKHSDTTTDILNEIQQELFTSFSYNDFKNSDIFSAMDKALSLNDILLKAKINFAKNEMCKELEYCLELPEINNYFKIMEAKDHIKNYIVSTERLFVERIEKEFPEIKSPSFIYMYNKVKSTLEQYKWEIFDSEQFFVRDFVNAVIYHEFDNPQDNKAIKKTLKKIQFGIYSSPEAINAKSALEIYTQLFTQFAYVKSARTISFESQIEDSRLFHGVLVTNKLKPILPIAIQSKIINMPYEAQVNLARNYINNSMLDLLDQFYVSPTGELKLDDDAKEICSNMSSTIYRLANISTSSKLKVYREAYKSDKSLKNEINLVQYILYGLENDYTDSTYSTISIPNNKDDNADIQEEPNQSIEDNNEETIDSSQLDEVVDYNKAKKYINIILKETDEKTRSKMLLALQKRINSTTINLQDVQIENLNESLTPLGIALRTPSDYVAHLVEKYKADKRDLNSLQVGLKLRIRTGNLVLTDNEINTINEENNMQLVQRVKPRVEKIKLPLNMTYTTKILTPAETKEKLQNPEALIRHTLKKKSTKLGPLDIKLWKILSNQ